MCVCGFVSLFREIFNLNFRTHKTEFDVSLLNSVLLDMKKKKDSNYQEVKEFKKIRQPINIFFINFF